MATLPFEQHGNNEKKNYWDNTNKLGSPHKENSTFTERQCTFVTLHWIMMSDSFTWKQWKTISTKFNLSLISFAVLFWWPLWRNLRWKAFYIFNVKCKLPFTNAYWWKGPLQHEIRIISFILFIYLIYYLLLSRIYLTMSKK